jgi:hypothetical protein
MTQDEKDDAMGDICAAADALLNWMYSQEMSAGKAVPILCVALASMIEACAVRYNKNPYELRCAAVTMILHTTDLMSEE